MPTQTAAESVLVVAQSPSVRLRIVGALRERGVATVEAVGIADAIRIMAPGVPWRIVVASRLGTERGLQLANMLARLDKTARIPFVLVVGDHDGVKELKGARLRPSVLTVMGSEPIEQIVERILQPEFESPAPATVPGAATEPGHVWALDAAFGFFDELLDLVVNDQLPGPVVPGLLLRVQQLFADPRVDGRRVVTFVGEHQALAARVLRMANSAYYAMSSRVVSIDDAVTRLGLGKVKDAMQAIAALEYLSVASGELRTAIGTSLVRGYFVGMLSQGLAEAAAFDDTTSAFSAGLFHNVGVTFLLYAAAVLQEEQRRPPGDIPSIVTTAHHESLRANRLLRHAMHLPVEIEALHGDTELTDAERPPNAQILDFVRAAMWAADRVLPDGGQPLMLDGDAQMIGMDKQTVTRTNTITRKLLPMMAAYHR